MRVAVVGPGAIGATFGAAAEEAGHEVVLCGRRPAALFTGSGASVHPTADFATETWRKLVLNAVAGLWWADPLAALFIAGVAVKEGRESWRGEGCADGCC